MFGARPPIPPPFGASSGNLAQGVVDENLSQLLDSRGGSHVINVLAFDKEDFTSWKVRFLVFLDGLEPYLMKTLEDGPFVPMSSLSTFENLLPKRQNQWSNAESRLANQDKRLNSIIISCLPNDVMKSTCSKVTLDQLLSEQIPGNIVKALGGKGRRKENNPSKEVLFTKADVSTSEFTPMITSDFEDDSDIQEPLPPLPNWTRADPSSASKSFISLSDLTANMVDLTLNTASKEIKISSNKVSQTYVIKKRTESKHPAVQNSRPDKNAFPSTKQLLLTLMEEVKGIKNQILIPSNTSSSVSQACNSKTPKQKVWCKIYGSIAHEIADCLKNLRNSRKQKDYLKRFVWYLDSGCYRYMTGAKQYLHRYSKEPCPKVVFGDDSSGDTEGYVSVNYNGIIFTRIAYVNGLKHNLISISQSCDANFKVLFIKTQGTIFNQNDEVVLISPRRKDVYVTDMSSFIKESNACFLAKASPRAVNTACYTQNRSIIVKRHGKTVYDMFRGRSLDISYFYAFGCLDHIYNHMDHLENFDKKADDGFFLGYSLVAKAFRVIEGDAINFNENRSFPDDEFIEPRHKDTQCSVNIKYFPYVVAYENITSAILPTLQNSITSEEPPEFTIADSPPTIHEPDYAESADILESAEPQDNVLSESISDDQPALVNSPSAELILQNPVPQDRWSREKHIKLVNIIGEPLAGITTRSRIRDSDAPQHMSVYMSICSLKLNPRSSLKLWMKKDRLKWVFRNKMDEEGVVTKNKARLVAKGYKHEEDGCESAFLNGKISKEVYIEQPPRFESSEFLNYVCKLNKALYGMKQAPRAWYQANPKESYLVAVKRIFRYLKSTPNLGLWYPKGSGFDLKVYSDSDYAGFNLDRKSTSGGCQIVRGNLVCVIAISYNPVLHSRTKHIDIRYHLIRDHILKGVIELHFVPTDLQLADIFTKPLSEPSFTRLIAELGMLNIEKHISDKKRL
uniref:Retrovirus-related Pol polyprotein from transposon TNT 1-94 n=1 Tax=Tanacetum cinerariifolium TaxID=118510 RepID=A0A6L2JEC6_TANCI|nr:retrovirus-related Pol polyprotein from transposon TNT 1-94 [Tanacetum cinerariifolium]